jgi:hypothetical protein
MSETRVLSAPDLGDPNRLRLWLAVHRAASTSRDALDAWEFWKRRLDHLLFVRYLVERGRMNP